MDKSKCLEVSIESKNERMKYLGLRGDNTPIEIDYIPPLGDNDGYTPLELLLISLASCSASTIATILRSKHISIKAVNAKARGLRRETHPTGFKKITLSFKLFSNELTEKDVDFTLKVAEQSVCPVWCMLKDSVEISTDYTIYPLE